MTTARRIVRWIERAWPCTLCAGSGIYNGQQCQSCGGTGKQPGT